MHAPRNLIFLMLLFLMLLTLALAAGKVQAAPPAPTPDYGGRESAPLATAGDAAPNPAAQAGRAVEALVVVLAGVVGVVYVLKRFDLVRPGANGKPARIGGLIGRLPSPSSAGVVVVSSQSLPGGTMLHVVRVDGRNLLLAATAQSVTTVTEWSVPEADPAALADDFEDYLTRAAPDAPRSESGLAAANARLRSLLSSSQPEEPS